MKIRTVLFPEEIQLVPLQAPMIMFPEFIPPAYGHITNSFGGDHRGIDIANSGKPVVVAAAPGIVQETYDKCPSKPRQPDRNEGYGNFVVVDHLSGKRTLYAHLESVLVQAGQQVERAEILGRMGNSGKTRGVNGAHRCHFEVILGDSQRLDPADMLLGKPPKSHLSFPSDRGHFGR